MRKKRRSEGPSLHSTSAPLLAHLWHPPLARTPIFAALPFPTFFPLQRRNIGLGKQFQALPRCFGRESYHSRKPSDNIPCCLHHQLLLFTLAGPAPTHLAQGSQVVGGVVGDAEPLCHVVDSTALPERKVRKRSLRAKRSWSSCFRQCNPGSSSH